MLVFQFDDYKHYLQKIIDSQSKRGFQSLLAEAAGCQRAYISQMLNSQVHLTIDHATGISRFLNLSDLESDYFVELVALARAGTEATRNLLNRRLKTLRQQHEDLEKKFSKATQSSTEVQMRYYSHWHWSAVHVLCSIPRFQTADEIAGGLGLPQRTVEKILVGLSEMGLVAATKQGKWKPTKNDIFLPRKSVMTFTNHSNWRLKALENIQTTQTDSIHYTALHALSRKDALRIKDDLMNFIASSRDIVAPSKEEEMICFTCDFFALT